jgi:predicted metal-dependent enzyme (double-stranded beta helix superfamily)
MTATRIAHRSAAAPAIAIGPYSGLARDALPHALGELIEALDTCHATPGLGLAYAVTTALATALRTPDWLPHDMLEAASSTYARRLVYGDPAGRYSMLAIAWGPGQYSPVHLHHTWCAVGVYQGAIQEWQYAAPAPGQNPRIVSKKARRVGDCTFDPRMTSTHRIANVTRSTAVSVHIYGVAYDRIANGVNLVIS